MSFRIRILVAGVVALFLIMGLGERSAIGGVAVAPLKQEISLKPGETGKVTLTLAYNNRMATDTAQKMKLEMMDVLATDEGSLSFKNPGSLRNSASKWLAPEAGEVTLDPGEARTVDCRITVPESAAPGEYYAVVMVTLAAPGKTEKGVTVQYRIASGIFLTVLGRTLPREARITRCEFIWPTSSGIAPAPVSATQPAEDPGMEIPRVQVLLANTGQARFDGGGKLTVVNDQRRVVLVTPMTTKRMCVFAGDSRLFEARIPKALAPGKYTMRVEMDYQSEWAKVRKDLPVEILPEQAALLAELRQRQRQEKPLVEAAPENLSVVVPAGAMRSLAIMVKNVSDGDVACTAALAGDGVPGLSVLPDQFTITKGGKKTVVVRVETADGAAGPIAALLNVAASQDGGGHTELSIPVDVQRKTER